MNAPAVYQLSPEVCVASQLEPAMVAWVAEVGFKSIINNRPDFEAGPDQPTSAQMEQAARDAGLAYAYLPVAPMLQSAEDVARFAQLLQELPKPVLAYCRTGTRSGRLFQATL